MWINKIEKMPKDGQICNIKISKTASFESGQEAETFIIKEAKHVRDGQWFKDGQVYGSSVFAWE